MASTKRGIRPLLVHVTSHGYGHLNRTASILNRIAATVPIVIRCNPNLFDHWSERLRRPADLEAFVSDAGAVNPPGNSADTDPKATMELASRVHAEAVSLVDDEVERLRGAGAVLCDAPPVPLLAASRAGVPGFLLANFTWADIYAPFARLLGGSYPNFVRELRDCYRQARLLFRTEPAMSMTWMPNQENVGLVGTIGRNRRSDLARMFGFGPRDRVVYYYFGRYGQAELEWSRVARMRDERIQFVGFHGPSPGEDQPPNLHVVDATEWTGADLAASCDLIVAKAGYGTACEAMLCRKPLIFPPRQNFAEYRSLAAGLKIWGGGIVAPRRAFDRFAIESLVRRALDLKPGPAPFRPDGAALVASRLVRACGGADRHVA